MTSKEKCMMEFAGEIAGEILEILYATNLSVTNYDELQKEAERLALETYQNNRTNPDFAKMCDYIKERYLMNDEELIEFLSTPYMLKVAERTGLKNLIAYQRKDLTECRDWFSKRRCQDEIAAYNFFDTFLKKME